MEKKYTPCGGCGAEHPNDRCIGCGHIFEQLNPDLLKVFQEAEASKECDLQKVKEAINDGYHGRIEGLELREKAEQWFKEEVDKIDDEKRKEEVLLEDETYIGVWMQGYRAGEEARQSGARWVKAIDPSIEEGEYVAKFKPDNKKRDAVGVASVDEKYVRFLCPPYHDIIWSRNHEELQYLQVLDETGQ